MTTAFKIPSIEKWQTVGLWMALFAWMCGLASCGGGTVDTTSSSGPKSTLTISSQPPPDGVLNLPYNGGSFTMAASGGRPSYKWTWSAAKGSSLPPGLILLSNVDGTGTITGYPTSIGTYDVSVVVADSATPPATVNLIYTINVGASQQLTIASGTPPDGLLNQSYGGTHVIAGHIISGFPLSATGGVPSYTWTWSPAPGSSLPPGLKITVLFFGGMVRCCLLVPVISGTPTAPGTYDVILTVTDSASPPSVASANYTITIN